MKVNAVAGAVTAALLAGNAQADDNAAAEGASSVAAELPTFTVRAFQTMPSFSEVMGVLAHTSDQ